MFGGRRKLPVIAEISAPPGGDDRVWSLRREDFDQLGDVLDRVGARRVVMVSGSEDQIRVLAIGLAGAACAAGKRTILVECDLARPRLAADLGLTQSPGLHEYLRWEATAAEILQPLALGGSRASTASEPLVCVAGGRLASDPAALLGLQSFRHMAAKLRGAYDLIVLSGSSVGSDPACLEAIGTEADAVLAAVSSRQGSDGGQKVVRSVLSRLPAAGLGTVVVAG
jgi:Mrp family chromosome partitioning ATPase